MTKGRGEGFHLEIMVTSGLTEAFEYFLLACLGYPEATFNQDQNSVSTNLPLCQENRREDLMVWLLMPFLIIS